MELLEICKDMNVKGKIFNQPILILAFYICKITQKIKTNRTSGGTRANYLRLRLAK